MTNDQFTRVQQARDHLAKARAAFRQDPTPSLARSIAQLQRFIRRNSVTRYHVECTDTYGGEANYCWVRRFAVNACSLRGASIVAARHLGYSGRIRNVGTWGDGGRWDVQGAAVCFFISWGNASEPGADDYPPINLAPYRVADYIRPGARIEVGTGKPGYRWVQGWQVLNPENGAWSAEMRRADAVRMVREIKGG